MPNLNIPLSRLLRRKIRRLWNLPSIARKLNLSVARQQSLRNQFLGLDSKNRKLLLLKKERDKYDYRVIDLADVQDCSVKKEYGSIAAGDLQTKGLNHFLKSISLRLGFKSGAKTVDVHFYESSYHTMRQQTLMEAAAKKWERFVSEHLQKPAAA